MRRELTEPEALVWAAAFTANINCRPIAPHIHPMDADEAVKAAHRAVTALRSVRVGGRHEQPDIRMMVDFRMDGDRE